MDELEYNIIPFCLREVIEKLRKMKGNMMKTNTKMDSIRIGTETGMVIQIEKFSTFSPGSLLEIAEILNEVTNEWLWLKRQHNFKIRSQNLKYLKNPLNIE